MITLTYTVLNLDSRIYCVSIFDLHSNSLYCHRNIKLPVIFTQLEHIALDNTIQITVVFFFVSRSSPQETDKKKNTRRKSNVNIMCENYKSWYRSCNTRQERTLNPVIPFPVRTPSVLIDFLFLSVRSNSKPGSFLFLFLYRGQDSAWLSTWIFSLLSLCSTILPSVSLDSPSQSHSSLPLVWLWVRVWMSQ